MSRSVSDASDGDPTDASNASFSIVEEGVADNIFECRIVSGNDDVEVYSSTVDLTSSDLELTEEAGNAQTIGLRFVDVDVPQGATIINAYVQFQVDETSSETTSLVFEGHDEKIVKTILDQL